MLLLTSYTYSILHIHGSIGFRKIEFCVTFESERHRLSRPKVVEQLYFYVEKKNTNLYIPTYYVQYHNMNTKLEAVPFL